MGSFDYAIYLFYDFSSIFYGYVNGTLTPIEAVRMEIPNNVCKNFIKTLTLQASGGSTYTKASPNISNKFIAINVTATNVIDN